jgi:hypothetical protein
VKWLMRRDTRRARLLILRLRIRTLRYGDDFAETYLAIDATIYGLVLILPRNTMVGPAWHVIAQLTDSDTGLGVVYLILAAALWLSALRLVPCGLQRATLVAALSVWVAMAVGFFAGYPWSIGPWVSLLNAFAAWVAYLRTDQ